MSVRATSIAVLVPERVCILALLRVVAPRDRCCLVSALVSDLVSALVLDSDLVVTIFLLEYLDKYF
jgi:hypothetical protein